MLQDGSGLVVRTRPPLFVLGVAVFAAAPLAATPDGVRVSARVTDRQGKPIGGLTLEDSELGEAGVGQKLVAVEGRRAEPRRFATLLDEFQVQPSDTARVRDAVARFVGERLRADDAAVVVKPLDSLTAISLTTDRSRFRDAIADFEGRKGNLEPRTRLEEETLGRAPALVEAGRTQVVLSALRALAGQLGLAPGRSAILLVSEGFAQEPRRLGARGLPDVGIVERFANRYDVPVYAFDPRSAYAEPDGAAAMLGKLVSETGGGLSPGEGPAGNLARARLEIDPGSALTPVPARGAAGPHPPALVSSLPPTPGLPTPACGPGAGCGGPVPRAAGAAGRRRGGGGRRRGGGAASGGRAGAPRAGGGGKGPRSAAAPPAPRPPHRGRVRGNGPAAAARIRVA